MKRFREEPFIMGERIEMMIRKAVPQDLDALIALIVRRMAWMDEQGIEQWNTGDYLGIYPPADSFAHHFRRALRGLGRTAVRDGRFA